MEDERTKEMVEKEEHGEKSGGRVKVHMAKPRHDRRAAWAYDAEVAVQRG